MINIRKYLKNELAMSIESIIPGAKECVTVMNETNKPWHYSSPAAIQIYNKYVKTVNKAECNSESCYKLASKIQSNFIERTHKVVDKIELLQLGKGKVETSPHFINLYLKPSFIEKLIIDLLLKGPAYKAEEPLKYLVDFSSPNIAKNMHVGHLRSTIIGESICRILESLGHSVDRINHIGDWGTQFGMLIAHLDSAYPNYLEEMPNINDLQAFYQNAKKRFDSDKEFKEKARQIVVNLQNGCSKERNAWKIICDISKVEYDSIYKRLDIKINDVGESFYNDQIPTLIKQLENTPVKPLSSSKQKINSANVVSESDGCKCIFVPDDEVPLIIQKSDGGYTYDSTDLAAINYRLNKLRVDRIVYVTDIGQEGHFMKIFKAAQMSGIYDPLKQNATHVGFGLMLGDDGGKIKTRQGDSVKLHQLLDEATNRAEALLKDRATLAKVSEFLKDQDLHAISEAVGINSIKYYDLKQNRVSSYKFSFESMLDTKGNTGVYVTYMYVRICSILSKCGHEQNEVSSLNLLFSNLDKFKLSTKEEIALALAILKLPESIDEALEDFQITKICQNLYDLSVRFAEFYENNRVIGDENETSRILLLTAVKLVMEKQFHLLGMKAITCI